MNWISMININDEKKARNGLGYQEEGMKRKDRGIAVYESLEYGKKKRFGNAELQMELLRNFLR